VCEKSSHPTAKNSEASSTWLPELRPAREFQPCANTIIAMTIETVSIRTCSGR